MDKNRLTKTNETDAWVFGVIGGLSRKLGIDPTIPRIVFLIATLMVCGSLALVYLVLAMLMPRQEPNL
jgi:phage shock protein PspC (stress-responsive transcriptional regulator)